MKLDDSSRIKTNCAKYTLNYTNRFSNTTDSLIIYGTVRICETNKAVKSGVIFIYDKNNLKVRHIITDAKGDYRVNLKPDFYRFVVETDGASLEIPYTHLGSFGSCMNIDLYLIRHLVLIDSFNSKKLRHEIELLKKKK